MSRNPCVVMSAQVAPVLSKMVLTAIVVPCRNSRAARNCAPAFATPFSTPATSRAGVVSVLPRRSSPVVSSNAATSVKVPPTSAYSRSSLDSIVLKRKLRQDAAVATISTASSRRNAGPVLHAGGRFRTENRHDLAGEKADRPQALVARQIAEGELPDEVVAAGVIELGGEELRHRRRRAGDALAALDHQVEGRRAGMRLLALMPAEQIGKARVPDQVGAPRERHCRRVGRRHHNEAAEPELRERGGARMHLRPDRAITLHGETGLLRRVKAHDVEIAARRALGAVRHVHAVPDRRMRLLQWRDLHGYVVEGKSLALEVENLLRQAFEHELDGLAVDLLRLVRIGAVVLDLDRHGAAAEADLEPTAAQVIEHADFFEQPQRMVQRHRPYQWAESQPARALRDGGQEHAGRGRHAERRRMVLSEMIGVESRAIVGLCNLEAVLVIVRKRAAVAIEMIEDPEFHCLSALCVGPRRSSILIICAGEATAMTLGYR